MINDHSICPCSLVIQFSFNLYQNYESKTSEIIKIRLKREYRLLYIQAFIKTIYKCYSRCVVFFRKSFVKTKNHRLGIFKKLKKRTSFP